MNDQITRDLGMKLRKELAVVLEREIRIAGALLEPDAISVILLNAATMMVRSVAGSIAGIARDGATTQELYDLAVVEIFGQVARGRDEALSRVAITQAGRRE